MEASDVRFLTLDHHSLIISDPERSKFFYGTILGLELDRSRPKLSVEGMWFKVGQQAIHCLLLPNPDPVVNRPEHGGRDRHVALKIADLAPLIERLDRYNVPYTRSKSGRRAIFLRDPDANAIEVIED
jgi:glyoxylase I family protein